MGYFLAYTAADLCVQALGGVWVNIHDLVHAIVDRDAHVRTFRSKAALRKYTFQNKLVFPKDLAKESSLMKVLLIDIFA